ncbi:integrase catalytic domain-containing protein [Trichonephila clavipes]|nr:integrase catalytic domain-containing protein [Trichonephila clavipes]
MDNILSGESTLEGAKKLQTRLSQLLQRGGFELHKWVSNSPELLKDLSASSYVFDEEFQDAPLKTLGMLWDPKVDCLTYKIKISDKVNFSKRDVLSEIARLYDPLGLIGPIVTKSKIFTQEFWKIKLDWSEQLPPDAMEECMNFYQKLSRNKSRVAPLKTLTIPRLELSAALLLSRLVKKVVPILQLPIHKIWMWTDSTIALPWIKTEPHKLKTFVSNRGRRSKHFQRTIIGNMFIKSCNKEKYLTADEIKSSMEFLAKIAQLSEFKAEIDALKKGKGVSKTKAVTDLTTEAFIAALKRLCARRGRISTLMSDNATNFKSAAAELNRFIKLICNKNETLANYFASKAIQWKFIPPRSRNFVGLWEAGQRYKWQFEKNNVAVGCLVLLKENDLPPCKWAMARILEVIYGTDKPQVTQVIPSNRLRWLGHIWRSPENNQTIAYTFKNPMGSGTRGRPRTRWIDDVENDLKTLNIKNWQSCSVSLELEEASCGGSQDL